MEKFWKRGREQAQTPEPQTSRAREVYEAQQEMFDDLREQMLALVEQHNEGAQNRHIDLVRHFGEFYNDEQPVFEYTGYWANDMNSHAPVGFHYDIRDGVFRAFDGSSLGDDAETALMRFKERLGAIPKKDEPTPEA